MDYTDLLISGILLIPCLGLLVSSFKAIVLRDSLPKLILPSFATILLIADLIISSLLWLEVRDETTATVSFTNGISVDWLSATLAILFQFIFLIAGLFSIYYISETRYGSYFTLFFSLQVGLSLVIFASNLFILFVFWEIMVVSGYVLVVFEKKDESLEAGFKYLVMSSTGSLIMLLGIALLTGLVDDLSFEKISQATNVTDTVIGKLAIALIVIGFGFTAGIVTLNQWLPDAHPAAPAPVSSLLSGIIVKAGIYGIYRSVSLIVPTIGFESATSQVIIIVGLVTMTEGNIMVLAQLQRKDSIDFKRILAYSTTVHLGYLLMVAGFQSDLGSLALIFHMVNHALAKGLLFLVSGYLIHVYRSRDLRDLQGVGRYDKILGFVLFTSFMSLGGLPLTGGFVSKLLILMSVYNEASFATGFAVNLIFWALVIAVINSALAFGGYLWIIKEMIFNPPNENLMSNHKSRNGDNYVKLLFVILSIIIIFLGVYPQIILFYIESML
ncbi:MAG: complex I subunit 5 family protein [Candidatus Kariarchaeaceae archaeon]|jgi:multicomponent Na+:H+ antiporter subunit D